jgi:hypothetical protein
VSAHVSENNPLSSEAKLEFDATLKRYVGRYEQYKSQVLAPLDTALMLAVSSIGRDVGKALSGSIVSVQSQANKIGEIPVAAIKKPSEPDKPASDSSKLLVEAEANAKAVRMQAAGGNASHEMKAAIATEAKKDVQALFAQVGREWEDALVRVDSIDRSAVVAAAAEIGKCQFGGTSATIESRRKTLKISPVPPANEVVLDEKSPAKFIVAGGSGSYKTSVIPPGGSDAPGDNLKVDLSQSQSLWVVTLTAKSGLTPGAYILVVVDSDTGEVAQRQVIMKKASGSGS